MFVIIPLCVQRADCSGDQPTFAEATGLIGGRTPIPKPLTTTVVDGIALDGPSDNPRQAIEDAIGIIDACVTTYPGQQGRIFDRLAKRHERLIQMRDAPPRPQRDPAKAVNRRPAHAVTLGQPPTTTANLRQ